MKMKLPLLAGCLAVFCLSKGTAQDRSSLPITRSTIQLDEVQIIKQAIGITPKESKDFLPIYQQYQKELSDLQKKNNALITISNDEISDDEAWLNLDEFLKYEKDKVNLRKKYANRFRMVLPPKKAARYFLLESKMDAIRNYDLAGVITLSDIRTGK